MKKTALSLPLSREQQIYGWAWLFIQMLILPTAIYAAAATLGIVSEGIINFLYYLLNFVACGWIFRDTLYQSLLNAGRDIPRFLMSVVLGFLAYSLCSYGFSSLLAILTPEFSNVNDAAIAAMVREHPVLMGFGTVVLVPLAEECLYRGLIFTPLRGRSRTAAYLVSTMIFAAIHVVGYVGVYPAGTLALCFLQYLPAGLCLAWAYDQTGSLFAPILIHGAVNLTSIIDLHL